ncbi:MAG TPA: ribosome maturation factor RimM [Thermoanaerobaculia bacterium]|nr:ribosome maturation factor RimM [Thermoanaerobaculia bacterium]
MSSKSSKTEAPEAPTRRDDLPETVAVGRVLRSHGLKGEVVVEVLSDVPGRYEKGSRVQGVRAGRPPLSLVVASSRPQKGGAVVRFEGYEDRDRAEELRGLDLEVPRSEVPKAPEGTYYQFELLGCLCFNEGEALGRVVEVTEDGGGLMLIVEGEGRRVPVPFVREFLREVDVEAGRIDLVLPPGLLEACASGS